MAEHIKQLHQILGTLQNNGRKIKLPKCSFEVHEINVIGYIVSVQAILLDNNRIEAVTNTPRPKCTSEERSFLGLTNYSDTYLITAASHTFYTNWPRPQVPFIGEKNKTKASHSSSKLYQVHRYWRTTASPHLLDLLVPWTPNLGRYEKCRYSSKQIPHTDQLPMEAAHSQKLRWPMHNTRKNPSQSYLATNTSTNISMEETSS